MPDRFRGTRPLKNEEAVRLANEVALLAHETSTEAIRKSLEERRERLIAGSARGQSLVAFLEKQVWPFIPAEVLGKLLTREEEDSIPGYGQDGC